MDAFGHVNNVVFLRILEEARVRVLGSVDGDTATSTTGVHDFGELPKGTYLLVARNEIEYLAQLAYRSAPIAVDMWITRIGGASFAVGYTVREPNGERDYVQAETTLVIVSQETGKPIRLPAAYRANLERYLGQPVPFKRPARDR